MRTVISVNDVNRRLKENQSAARIDDLVAEGGKLAEAEDVTDMEVDGNEGSQTSEVTGSKSSKNLPKKKLGRQSKLAKAGTTNNNTIIQMMNAKAEAMTEAPKAQRPSKRQLSGKKDQPTLKKTDGKQTPEAKKKLDKELEMETENSEEPEIESESSEDPRLTTDGDVDFDKLCNEVDDLAHDEHCGEDTPLVRGAYHHLTSSGDLILLTARELKARQESTTENFEFRNWEEMKEEDRPKINQVAYDRELEGFKVRREKEIREEKEKAQRRKDQLEQKRLAILEEEMKQSQENREKANLDKEKADGLGDQARTRDVKASSVLQQQHEAKLMESAQVQNPEATLNQKQAEMEAQMILVQLADKQKLEEGKLAMAAGKAEAKKVERTKKQIDAEADQEKVRQTMVQDLRDAIKDGREHLKRRTEEEKKREKNEARRQRKKEKKEAEEKKDGWEVATKKKTPKGKTSMSAASTSAQKPPFRAGTGSIPATPRRASK